MQHNDLLGILVATFRIRACAEEAIRDLHHAGVRHTWIGVAKSGDDVDAPQAGTVSGEAHERVEEVGIRHVIARWFHRERDETLYDALLEHGVAEGVARRIDGAVAEGNWVLVAEDVLIPEEATWIALRHGGTVLVTDGETDVSAWPSDPMVQTRVEAARRHPSFLRPSR
jgi:hypothetical protein